MLVRTFSKTGLPRLFGEFDSMERQFANLFTSGQHGGGVFPSLNLYRSEDAVKVSAFLPGFKRENLDITVLGNRLTIKGEQIEEENENYTEASRRERFVGSFERSISLPFSASGDGILADYKKGILSITVKMPEEDKPKSVAIKTN